MSRATLCISILTALFSFTAIYPLESAETVVIPFTDCGWYENTGFHNPNHPNYVVGDLRGNPFLYDDYRNFFVFDLSSVTQPIATAKLALFVPGPPLTGYLSGDPIENYQLHDVTTPIATLLAGTDGVATHNDLGSGVVYGSRSMTEADEAQVVEIILNSAAISALNAATGLFAIGGALTTLDGLPNSELTFGNSGLTSDIRELRLTLVPEPSSLTLFALAMLGLSLKRRRQIRQLKTSHL